MALDIHMIPFEGGDSGVVDREVGDEILDGLATDREESFLRIVTDDGDAEVYGVDDPSTGLMITHAAGRTVWDVIYLLAKRAGYTVLPVGCPMCITDEEQRSDLPESIPQPVIVISSGADLLDAVENA